MIVLRSVGNLIRTVMLEKDSFGTERIQNGCEPGQHSPGSPILGRT